MKAAYILKREGVSGTEMEKVHLCVSGRVHACVHTCVFAYVYIRVSAQLREGGGGFAGLNFTS